MAEEEASAAPSIITRNPNSSLGWQSGLTIAESNRYMFENQIGADVVIEVGPRNGPTERLVAHRYVLISRSQVFEGMLCREPGLSVASAEETAGIVRVTDSDPATFREMLKFMYYDDVNITTENVTALLYLAKKYLLSDLAKRCHDHLEKKITLETVCSIVNAGAFYDEQDLIDRCLKFIGPRMTELMASDYWLTLSQYALESIIRYDYHYVKSEMDIYKACVRWAREQYFAEIENTCSEGCALKSSPSACSHKEILDCDDTASLLPTILWASAVEKSDKSPPTTPKVDPREVTCADIRRLLGGALFRIRFVNLAPYDFAIHFGTCDLLTEPEKAAIYRYSILRASRPRRKADAHPLQDVKNPGRGADGLGKCCSDEKNGCSHRHGLLDSSIKAVAGFDVGQRVQMCNRFTQLGTASQWWSCNGPADAVCIQVDRDIDIVGLALYGGKEKASHVVSVSVVQGTNDNGGDALMRDAEIRMESTGDTKPVPIFFPRYVHLRANTPYTIVAALNGPLTYYGQNGVDSIDIGEGCTFRFLASARSTNGTNQKNGQIPQILYKLC